MRARSSGDCSMRLVEADAERLGDQLGDAVDVAVGHAEHAADVADRGARLQLAEGDDLRDAPPVVALAVVLLGDVADHLVAPRHAEVDVDVGHRDPLGVQEALEDDVVLDRIDAGDAEAVGDQAAGRGAAARADRDAVAPRVVDEVGDDQEVAGEAHRVDHAELVLACASRTRRASAGSARPARGPRRARSPCQACSLEHAPRASCAGGHLELGHVVAAAVEIELELAALGDLERVRTADG